MSSDEEEIGVLPGEDEDLEVIDDPADTEGLEQNNEETAGNDNDEEGNKKDSKVKQVRNPQPKLNADTLKGPRGIQVLEKLFGDVKFKGRGHEEEDLMFLMKTYEYWCHRLFPKFPFDDCLERLERLGSKKPVQTHIKKIRMNMLNEDEVDHNLEDDDDIINRDAESTQGTPLYPIIPPITRQQPVNEGLTEEQFERIRINRERAQRLRQQTLIRKKLEASTLGDLLAGSSTINESTSTDLDTFSALKENEIMATDLLQSCSKEPCN